MTPFLSALVASTLSSLGGLAGGILLLAREQFAQNVSRYLMSFAAGALLGVSFFDLLPEAVQAFAEPHLALQYVFFGVVIFFFIERIIASMHVHQDEAEGISTHYTQGLYRARPLVILGDTLHNFLDGIVVAIAFLAGPEIGVPTAISIFLHELPHEIADFSILLRSGMARSRVLLINFFSALVAPLGTVTAYLYAAKVESLQPPLLAIAAGNLLYIALADLIPHLHHERRLKLVVIQLCLFLVGAGIFLLLPRE